MEAPPLVTAILLGIVEGLTEFLPISSTGHLIIAGSLLGYVGAKASVFEIAIQSGAMLAVVWEYRKRFAAALTGALRDATARRFIMNLVIAFIPAALLGLLVGGAVKSLLFHPVPVAVAFVVGALIILWVERRQARRPLSVRVDDVDDMTATDALKIGLAQTFALIPGTSRSGATIIGGMLFGLSRKAATEFSFFLAVPTLVAAGAYSLWKERSLLSSADIPSFAVGIAVSFVAALLCIRWLVRYVSRNDFVPFAWYRIAFGIIVLITAQTGLVAWE
ncbi:MAG TPA: undecaprenyl-diphosphate phosphatase [Casimicrobiaceae bacterium]|nr:undecaprenyl-diphosphate phosphatase [Casimicrobiaceae bacterium]